MRTWPAVVSLNQDIVAEPGRAAIFWMLIAFVLTFLITRTVTRHIQAKSKEPTEDAGGRSLIGDITIGGVHIHHQVWGILLVLVSALLEFAYRPDRPFVEILGVLFGIGAALALDEFALWVYMDDVYWKTEGRTSIDAVIVAASVCLLLVVGLSPFDVAGLDQGDVAGYIALIITVLINGTLAVICFFKGKLFLGFVAIFLSVVGLIGAIRLARPNSPWARRRYVKHPKRMERAKVRGARHDKRMDGFRRLIGGDFSGT
jgi:hypothetical protein